MTAPITHTFSLGEALEAGLVDEHDADTLAYEIREGNTALTRERRSVQALLRRADARDLTDVADARRAWWVADLLDQPDLAARVVALLDEPARTETAHALDVWRSPHPLLVAHRATAWCCSSCGTEHDTGTPAAVVGDRPGWSDLDAEIVYCAECIASALTAMGVARVVGA